MIAVVSCACLAVGVPAIHSPLAPIQGLGWVLTAYGVLAGAMSAALWLERLCY